MTRQDVAPGTDEMEAARRHRRTYRHIAAAPAAANAIIYALIALEVIEVLFDPSEQARFAWVGAGVLLLAALALVTFDGRGLDVWVGALTALVGDL